MGFDMGMELTRAELEEFFCEEAALLDEWRLNEWTEWLTPEVRYLIPPHDEPNAEDYNETLFLACDDYRTLLSRVRQLLGPVAWAENPRSRTRRLVTNARILEIKGDEARVTANFAVWRFQYEESDVFVGRYVHRLVRGADGRLLFRERKSVLDLEALRPHGKVSFIL